MNDKITRGSTWSICFKFKPEQLVNGTSRDCGSNELYTMVK